MPARLATAVLVALSALGVASANAFSPEQEAANFAKVEERQAHVVMQPEFIALMFERGAVASAEVAAIHAADPERNFATNACAQRGAECTGEVRFYDWEANGHGLMRPVLFTARSGATISGTVWATRRGPERRPLVVITTGSVQAPETLYWGIAANLAKRGYVVLTYDVQGQGQSDTFGEAPDANEGVPSQAGQPFYDGTEDALDFALSTPKRPFAPRPSCGNANDGIATSHAPKQRRRVREGLNAPFNPLHRLVDRTRVGIAGHSFGAAGVSYIGQRDRRVDALVAWDNLRSSKTGEIAADCPARPATRKPVPIEKPAMGISNDYFIAPYPFTTDPDPEARNRGFIAYKAAGVDSMQVNIRGGTHQESAFIPGSFFPFPLGSATLRGHDFVIWYTAAWFDRYVKCIGRGIRCRRRAQRLLLTDRWRDDALGAEVDLNGDGNLFSFYFRSRFDLTSPSGTSVVCDDMRAGCPRMGPDPRPADFSYVRSGLRPDAQ